MRVILSDMTLDIDVISVFLAVYGSSVGPNIADAAFMFEVIGESAGG